MACVSGSSSVASSESAAAATPEPAIECHADLRGFFHDLLVRAFAARHISVPPFTEAYLVAMLAALSPVQLPHASLTELRLSAVAAPPSERLDRLRAIGDLALSRVSLFEAKLGRIGVSKAYVADLGTQSYRSASQLASASHRPADRARAPIFFDLGDRFEAYAEVLEDLRESTSLGGAEDVLALYERYVRTGSSSVLAKLSARGVVCLSEAPISEDALNAHEAASAPELACGIEGPAFHR